MTIKSKTLSVLSVLVLTFIVTVPAMANGGLHRLVVFGDSLSDGGNYFAIYGQVSEAPFAPIPSAPYDEHGHQFTNGRTWIEQLTLELGMADSGRPSAVRPGVFTNYAVGRARARPDAEVFPYNDLGTQVATFLGDFGGTAPGNDVYVIWIGSNDLDDALTAGQSNPAQAIAIIQAALQAVSDNIEVLYASGARRFFILNLPDFGLTPAVQSLGPAAVAAATQLSTVYNGYLAQTIGELQALPGVSIATLDVFAFLHGVVADPAEYGIKDVAVPCLSFYVTVDAICSNPNRHLFWDAIHPTVAGHAALQDAARRALRPLRTSSP